ncbi:hypothetical protein IJJ08_00875 [bacterium]|nr:hypothetical protein [bacterium]
MPSNNAYDFLRQSIAGQAPVTGSPRPAGGVDYSAIQPEQLVYRAPGEQPREQMPVDLPPVPPILTLPPGVEMLDFVGRVERAYDLHYTDEKYVAADMRTPEGNAEHAVELMDHAAVYMAMANYPAASDIFSLCLILSPNYFYHFCLASARFQMGDFEGALVHERAALDGIRAKEQLSTGLMYYFDQLQFVDTFYFQLIECLIYTGNLDEAKKMTDFVVDGNFFELAQTYLDLACDFSLIGELAYAAKLIDRVMPYLDELNEEARQFALAWIPNILAGHPGAKVDIKQAPGSSERQSKT